MDFAEPVNLEGPDYVSASNRVAVATGRGEGFSMAQDGVGQITDGRQDSPRGPRPAMTAHEECQIASCDMNQQPFHDVVVFAQVRAPHSAGFVAVGERAFQELPTLSQQRLAAFTLNAPSVCIDAGLLPVLPFPVPSAAIGLREVRSYLPVRKISDGVVAVISLVRNDFLDAVFSGRWGLRQAGLCDLHCVRQRPGVTLVRMMKRDRDNGPGFQVNRMLCLMRQMRAPVLHLCDACIRIVRAFPFYVGALFKLAQGTLAQGTDPLIKL